MYNRSTINLNVIKCLALMMLVSHVEAQQKPFLYDVSAQADVTYDSTVDLFTYEYTVTNGSSSPGSIWTFDIDISRDSLSVAYDTTGLKFKRPWIESSFRRHFPRLAHRIVPTGFPDTPDFWGGLLGDDGTGGFGGTRRNLILPGQTLNGFLMTSRGLPGIRFFIAEPHYDPNDYYPSIDDPSLTEEDVDLILAQVDSDYVQLPFKGKTVGPTAPAAILDASTFLDTLISYTTQSLPLGWIADQTTADKYEGHFSTAQIQLQQADTTAARSELQTILQEVNEDSGSVLSSEAYALLHFNTEYLLDQLPVTVITVDIDIKPGSDPNSINPKSQGVIPVAVLTDQNFDATTVDVSTVVFGPAGAQPVHNGHIEDVDGDGDDDLLLHFNTQDTGIQCGDTEATLSGTILGGEAIEGSDSIKTVGCK